MNTQNTNPESELEYMESSLEQAEDQVSIGEAIERLLVNEDFKQVITEGYLKEEPSRLIGLMSAPNFQDAETQSLCTKDLHSIGAFQRFISTQRMQAQSASAAIVEYKQQIETMRSGEED